MKKTHIAALFLLFPAAALAASDLPAPGTYEGQGTWRAKDGTTGTYQVVTSLGSETMESTYTYRREGKSTRETYETRLVSTGKGFYRVEDAEGRTIGEGHCFEGECSFEVTFPGVEIRESLRETSQGLHRFGSKKTGEWFQVVWREDLARR